VGESLKQRLWVRFQSSGEMSRCVARGPNCVGLSRRRLIEDPFCAAVLDATLKTDVAAQSFAYASFYCIVVEHIIESRI